MKAISPKNNFKKGILLSTLLSMLLFSGSLILGKVPFFLLLNNDLGKISDYFFNYFTYLGDGSFWVAIVILTMVYDKKFLPLIVFSIIFSTLITQICKNIIFPEEYRPTYGITNFSAIHTVPDVTLHLVNSFPSGHTGTAFSIFLIGCLLIKKTWIVPVGFLYACLVGYSRIYLAQHFPIDIAAGIVTGIISVSLSWILQNKWIAHNVKK